jgi:dethiobiotin synthetase
MPGVFVTGTDTGVGKTLVSVALLRAAEQQGWSSLGLKPVAAGCERVGGDLLNEDALLLQQYASQRLAYAEVNPIALEPAIAPHIAAQEAGVIPTVNQLSRHCRPHLEKSNQFVVVEGAGGWRVPLNDKETLADLALALKLPVVLVVGFKLGCLNHALLSAEAIRRDGLQLAGWVANCGPEPMARLEENIASLASRLAAPCLARLPWYEGGPDIDTVAAQLDFAALAEPLAP